MQAIKRLIVSSHGWDASPSLDVLLSTSTLTLKMTTAQVVETSVTVTNSSFQNYTHPADHTRQPREIKIHVYGKRQTSDSRLRFLKMNNSYAKKVQNNSHIYG